ncbi:signal recognition particle, SRP19 subunit [Mytilinidion resinicola]|uniref:Signal recognition particle, SRP19 subunit n=1 Tax=Mytilinidion resinicola TaxID=574789 RepID=A0A6A6Z5R7_9PEZI|nr:signal recognition particle, SRP19 subunit [Mytilinidion resinicola]KAF2816069.1 signal recognition particle, SRP19 subunit [Mytilinidion resinicola]
MSRNARIEEISDSDSDPAEMDIADFDPANIMQMVNPQYQETGLQSQLRPADPSKPHQPQAPISPMQRMPPRPSQAQESQQSKQQAADREKSKHWQCLYPIYFDASRTRGQGRRIGKEQAVPNPLAREIAEATASLGLNVVFEPEKTHPKDWSNPGRVRVLVKEKGKSVGGIVANKHHLYTLVSKYLQDHPTTESSPLKLRIAGLPPPKEPLQPAIPRGWKMNTILPLHSPALTGGGVSENFLQEMMAEMQGGDAAAAIGAAGGSDTGKKKKDKKKIKG